MEVNRNRSVMTVSLAVKNLQVASINFVRAIVQNECTKDDPVVRAALRTLMGVIEPYIGEKTINKHVSDDVKYLHSRLVEQNNDIEDNAAAAEMAVLGEAKICENLITRIERLIESAPEDAIIPLIEKLDRIAVQPAHRDRLNFFKRALGIPTTGENK